ncbi:hypothetical protein EVAR_36939_1 [Eumeta japonica]|uniref:Uncharacterized protein n=1 Tax=Eumeta variegata TaxID=151549 RepID=A0A4C1X8A8_EUMVA|nr:hypothetical protein EVAR_36939_1 [Eumeta japonica]
MCRATGALNVRKRKGVSVTDHSPHSTPPAYRANRAEPISACEVFTGSAGARRPPRATICPYNSQWYEALERTRRGRRRAAGGGPVRTPRLPLAALWALWPVADARAFHGIHTRKTDSQVKEAQRPHSTYEALIEFAPRGGRGPAIDELAEAAPGPGRGECRRCSAPDAAPPTPRYYH